MTYFSGCHTAEDLKKRYLELAKANHPDKGGDAEIMKAINHEYDNLVEALKSKEVFNRKVEEFYEKRRKEYFKPHVDFWESTRRTDPVIDALLKEFTR